jgi:hypothetical protein
MGYRMVYAGQVGELEKLEDVLISCRAYYCIDFRDRGYVVLGLVRDGHVF